jgi:hypothetical protein
MLGYDVLMLVPEARRGDQDVSTAPWRDTRLTLTVRSTDGRALGGSTYRLGDLFAANGFGAGQYEALPEVTRAAPVGGDYDVEIRIDRPSARGGDRARIRATATTNDFVR